MPSKHHRSSRVHFVSKSSRDVTQWCNMRRCPRLGRFESSAIEAPEGGYLGDANTRHASLFGCNAMAKAPRMAPVRNARSVLTPSLKSCCCTHPIRPAWAATAMVRGSPDLRLELRPAGRGNQRKSPLAAPHKE
jgi:hypothetical protein